MTLIAVMRGIDGCLLLLCCLLVTHAPYSHPLVQTAADWQLKVALFILMMEVSLSYSDVKLAQLRLKYLHYLHFPHLR